MAPGQVTREKLVAPVKVTGEGAVASGQVTGEILVSVARRSCHIGLGHAF